ncbi:hypothetical protein CBX98_03050 [Vibrio sp. T9]|nr:hypothetical protein CBX98_03050 [Vibrio sp. T9]
MWTQDEKRFLQSNAGVLSGTEIAKKLGKSFHCVAQYASRANISLRVKNSSHRKVYSDEVVLRAKELIKSGELTNKDIGSRLNLPENYVAQLKLGRFRSEKPQNIQKRVNSDSLWGIALGKQVTV